MPDACPAQPQQHGRDKPQGPNPVPRSRASSPAGQASYTAPSHGTLCHLGPPPALACSLSRAAGMASPQRPRMTCRIRRTNILPIPSWQAMARLLRPSAHNWPIGWKATATRLVSAILLPSAPLADHNGFRSVRHRPNGRSECRLKNAVPSMWPIFQGIVALPGEGRERFSHLTRGVSAWRLGHNSTPSHIQCPAVC